MKETKISSRFTEKVNVVFSALKRDYFIITIAVIALLRVVTFSQVYEDGDTIRISTTVRTEPIVYENSRGIFVKGLWTYVDLYPEIHYGDFVVIEGVVDGRKLANPKVEGIRETTGPLFVLRENLNEFYSKSLPSPHDALVAGFVLGSKALMPRPFWEVLKKTGTAHVVVASGMNVTLVASFLMAFLVIFLPRKKAIFVALVGIWLYAVIAGFDAPIVRAAIMGSIAFGAQTLGRSSVAWRGLVLSALLMLILVPSWFSDLGFILSFVATGSLILFEKPIGKRLKKVPRILREDFSTSLAAQIGVAPILFVTFGYFNVLSPIINALILWIVAPVTIIGALAGLVGMISEPIGRGLILLVYPLTTWFVGVVNLFS